MGPVWPAIVLPFIRIFVSDWKLESQKNLEDWHF
jgi:hypothetical protein